GPPRPTGGTGRAAHRRGIHVGPAASQPDARSRRTAEAPETAPAAAIRGAGRSPGHGSRDRLTGDVSAAYRWLSAGGRLRLASLRQRTRLAVGVPFIPG